MKRCNEIASMTGLPPICAACNMGPCPHWVEPLTKRELAMKDALEQIELKAVRQQAAGGDLFDFQDRLRECANIARAAVRSAT